MSGSLVSVFNVNLQSTSRTQFSIAHSSAESELYAMTQAAVESLAIKNSFRNSAQPLCHLQSALSLRQIHQQENQGLRDWALHVVQSTSSSSIFGFRNKSGKLELEKVGTHFNLSDALTKDVPASAPGQHLPHLNVFKVNSTRSATK